MHTKSRSKLYYLINAAVMAAAVYFLCTKYVAGMAENVRRSGRTAFVFVIIMLFIAMIYAMKAFRLYVIFMDRGIGWIRFIEVYIKTMAASLAFPLKLGELFRMYCFGVECQSFRLGFLGVLIERFFDTIPLLILLVVFTAISGGTVIPLVIILAGFLVLISALYLSFPSIYSYMNRYFMINGHSMKAVRALKLLEAMKEWHGIIKTLIKDRVSLLLIISSLTWLSECLVLMVFVQGLGDEFSTGIFLSYISSVFSGQTNGYVDLYVGMSAVLLLIVFTVVYVIKYIRRGLGIDKR